MWTFLPGFLFNHPGWCARGVCMVRMLPLCSFALHVLSFWLGRSDHQLVRAPQMAQGGGGAPPGVQLMEPVVCIRTTCQRH